MNEIIKVQLEGVSYYDIFYDTIDVCGKNIQSLLIGLCFSIGRKKPFLIGIVELFKTNVINVNAQILGKINLFFNKNIGLIQKIQLLLSNAAPYTVKAAKMSKK